MTSEHHSRNGFLTVRGYAENAQQTSLEGLTLSERCVSLDMPVSVSALFEFELDDNALDEQYRRFQSGF